MPHYCFAMHVRDAQKLRVYVAAFGWLLYTRDTKPFKIRLLWWVFCVFFCSINPQFTRNTVERAIKTHTHTHIHATPNTQHTQGFLRVARWARWSAVARPWHARNRYWFSPSSSDRHIAAGWAHCSVSAHTKQLCFVLLLLLLLCWCASVLRYAFVAVYSSYDIVCDIISWCAEWFMWDSVVAGGSTPVLFTRVSPLKRGNRALAGCPKHARTHARTHSRTTSNNTLFGMFCVHGIYINTYRCQYMCPNTL